MGTANEQGGDADSALPLGWHAEEREHRRQERRFWGAYIGLTILIVIGAFLSALFAYKAYVASTQAVAEARRQANAGEAQIEVARDTEHRQLRAYLHIGHGPMTVSSNTASAEIRIHHSGQTPAYKIKLEADIQVGHFPLPDIEKLSLPTGGIPKYEFGALYGTDPIKQTISMPQNSDDAIEIQKRSHDRLAGGLQVFYLFGRVTYQDIFGKEWPYEFCYSFDPVNNTEGSERGCEKYNKPG
ncbi:hypothetical protein SAMN05216330_12433 [Bradyrhizobium sp. Ghvi]|uniref:hypothetical protein n=1 Tax=Bradyrhizobium sp. Ghvi TaxID=1855319 RepID=UPI0008EAE869|nr:hypothetical protein [Bradyrhizobium sp. Ghvi]SFQ30365.1 hypothetical protein SAMN05216330_12433 [Bradyrhizobium sp. Ghvi]